MKLSTSDFAREFVEKYYFFSSERSKTIKIGLLTKFGNDLREKIGPIEKQKGQEIVRETICPKCGSDLSIQRSVSVCRNLLCDFITIKKYGQKIK